MTDTRESLGLPWEQEDWDIVDQRGRDVADVTSQDRAAFIVTACNSHHDLVEVAERIVERSLAAGGMPIDDDELVDMARTALHKAKGAPHESE